MRLSNYFRWERTYFWDSLSRPTPGLLPKDHANTKASRVLTLQGDTFMDPAGYPLLRSKFRP